MKTLETAFAAFAAGFALMFSGCASSASVKPSEQVAPTELVGVLDYLTVYEQDGDKRFLANAVSEELFDPEKTTYEYVSSAAELVIRANLTGAALLDFDHDYHAIINDAEQAAFYPLELGPNVFTIKVLDAGAVLEIYTIYITRFIPEEPASDPE